MDVLNIGLDSVYGPKAVAAVLAAVIGRACTAVSCGVHQSDSEPTLVVVVDFISDRAVFALAEELAQDCIAVYHVDTGRGRLIGPDASSWGAFDPSYFIMPDGTRLATHGEQYQAEREAALKGAE